MHDRPPAERLGEQVHDRAVVDLRAEHPGAGDQRHQRQQRAQAVQAQHRGRDVLVRQAQRPQHDRQCQQRRGQQHQEERPPPAQQPAQGDARHHLVHDATR